MAGELASFLRVASAIASALDKVHERGLIHKDIKPANILVTCTDGGVRLTGFGLASRHSRERQSPEPPKVIAGTLAYIAPEQTGRTNRSIDSRSDLYALGVTLYEMLTGTLPFKASDPMEWVHCHIARQPVPPIERSENIPPVISQILMKLLAKTAEDRYQTAAGLRADLARCLAEVESRERIKAFPLGKRDLAGRLLIPERLYGREREISTLVAAFDRVVGGGGPSLVLVTGHAGIGKSAVVHELHRALVASHGLFAFGKFDQYQRDVPYASIAQALQSLVRPLLGKAEPELAPWRVALAAAVGPNGRLMLTLIPELELLIGPQAHVPELPAKDAQRRFQLVFRRLLGVFARPEHPLALFLDDLQWLDAATLDLLADLGSQADLPHLLLIGAYRSNEVTAAHPLPRRLAAIRAAGGRMQEIVLAPLEFEDVSRMLGDTLHGKANRTRPLARLVHQKTAGNPFFTIQFLSALHEEGLLRFDHVGMRWAWDLRRIRAKGYADNVVDLMTGRLRRLPTATQAAVRRLAVLGNSAPVATLTVVQGGSEESLQTALWAAVRAGLVSREEGTYRFLHDRVQEAAYASIAEGERAAAHLAIGRVLLAHTRPEAIEENVFDLVGQLNRAATLITSFDERERLAELNLVAGRRAKASAAYASALTYVTAGAMLLPDGAWERRYDLAFSMELHRAECEFLTGALGEAEARLALLASRAASLSDLALVTRLQVDLFMTLGQSGRAVARGLEYLGRVGIALSAHPTKAQVRQEYARIWRWLGNRPIEALLDLPRMTDPAALATMNVLASLVTPALFTDENLRALVIGRMANVSLQHGNSDMSPYAYTAVGAVLGLHLGNYAAGFRFGELGLDLVEQPGMDRLKARVYLAFGNLSKSSARHVRTGRPLADRVFETAQQAGDATYAVLSRNNLLTYLIAGGEPLSEVQRDAEVGLGMARQAGFSVIVRFITGQLQFIRTLRGLTPQFGCFNDADFDEEQFERSLDGQPAHLYWIRKLQARFLAGDRTAALAAAAKAERLLWMTPVIFERADYHFYAALALCDAPAAERRQIPTALAAHRRRLDEWARHIPESFASRAALVGAETARLGNRLLDAERLFERAIRSARDEGLVHDEAIAHERASAFYRARGFEQIAALYLQNARRCYRRWGADGRVRQLDALIHLREEAAEPSPAGTIQAPVEHLDLATVIKVSQAISSEIILGNLIDTLLRMAVQQAGAERGLLILLRDGEPRIVAEATASGDAIEIQTRDDIPTATTLPLSVLHYVLRTGQPVRLDDAMAERLSPADPYICDRAARSVLSLPMINQAKVIGALYLENNLAPGVFVPARISVLKLLASQAAVALESTRLYHELAERESRIRRLVESNIIGISIRDVDGRIIEANEAFLNMLGYSRADLLAGRLRWNELTPPDWREREAEAQAELKLTGRVQPFEKEYVRKDGSRLPVLIGVASFEDAGHQGVAFVLDLTERNRAEQALRASETRFRSLVDHATDAFFLLDEQLTIIDVNRQTCESLGYSREELIGKGPRDLDAALDEQSIAQLAERVRLGEILTFQTLHRRKDGTLFPVEVRVRQFQQGGKLFYLSLARDITQRVRAEEELRASERRYNEVRMELAHANRVTTMGQLTASIAHEVNQPITAAMTDAQAALRFLRANPPLLDEVRGALDSIVQSGHRAADVIGRIRDLTRKAPPRKDRLDINDTVREVIMLTTGEAAKTGVSVQTRFAAGLPPVRGDRVQLQQVLLNLIVNALEAMSGVGDPPKELLIMTAGGDHGDVHVTVRDSGPGLGPATRERLFDAFFTTKSSGMGLGLAICRSIVEAHGGRLWAEPNLPRGATFHFTLSPAGPQHADIQPGAWHNDSCG
jgi:PAS domain S-box-containing protein